MTLNHMTSMAIQDYRLWGKMKDKRVPLSFDLEITARCDNNCRHCYINLPANNRSAQAKELSPNEISRLADEAVSLGAMWCLITGGEPLLRPDFEEIYLFARRLGMKVMLFTNGRLITPHLTDLFARIPPLEPIEITVYGMHRESYEAVTRSPGSFAQFWRGVDLLLECGVPQIASPVSAGGSCGVFA